MNLLKPTIQALLLTTLAVACQGATITVSSPAPVTVGQPLTVDIGIDLDASEGLAAFQMDVLFPSFLQADSVVELGYFAANGIAFSPGFIDNTLLRISFIGDALSGSDVMTASGPLFQVTFTGLAPGLDAVTIDDLSVVLLDSQFADLPFTVTPGTVEVTAGSTADVPEPSTAGLLLAGALALLTAAQKRR